MSDLTPAEISRYRRQLSLAGFGATAQKALRAAHVAVVGAGGLGSPALLYLAGAGVGTITIIDDDAVEVSNLHRQVIHTTTGQPKAESARVAIAALNPLVSVHVVTERLRASNAARLLRDAQIVIDGSDNFATRYVVSQECARRGIPHVWASILGFDAQLSVFWAGRGPIYEDVFPSPPPAGSVPSCSEAGVLGAVVGVAGTALALEAIKLLTGVGTPLVGTLAYFSGLSGRWEYVELRTPDRQDAPHACRAGEPPARESDGGAAPAGQAPPAQEVPTVESLPARAYVLDVRDPDEFAAYAIPGAISFPLPRLSAGELPAGLAAAVEARRQVVAYCASGVRSGEAVLLLRERGIPAWSLRGGIETWLDQQA